MGAAFGNGGGQSPAARPTMRDVARAAGVSTMTVSRVVNGDKRVKAGTKSSVLKAIELLEYRPNSLARGLRPNQTTGLIGLVATNLANPFYAQLAVAVEQTARSLGYAVIMGTTGEDPGRERELVEDLLVRQVDGLIVVPAGDDHGYLAEPIGQGTAVVFLSRPPRGISVDVALVDDYGGARQGVGALLREGHRRVGYIGHSRHIYTASERLRGYRDALCDAGLPVDEGLIHSGASDAASSEGAAAGLLNLPDPATALFTTNNRITVGALRAISKNRASETPPGTSLVGFDDFELADLVELPFSVVVYDAAELGRATADLLTKRIEGSTDPPVRVVVGTHCARRGGKL